MAEVKARFFGFNVLHGDGGRRLVAVYAMVLDMDGERVLSVRLAQPGKETIAGIQAITIDDSQESLAAFARHLLNQIEGG